MICFVHGCTVEMLKVDPETSFRLVSSDVDLGFKALFFREKQYVWTFPSGGADVEYFGPNQFSCDPLNRSL